jgi:hypothetical protein
VKRLLANGEIYATFLVTDNRVHCFLLGKNGFKATTSLAPADEMRKAAHSLAKNVANPRRYRITKLAHDLWYQLFGGFQEALFSYTKLVIETDGFLNFFPFEALAPTPVPQTSRKRLETPLLMDHVEVSRTTSAFRFVGQRSGNNTSEKKQSVVVFAGPVVSFESGAGKAKDEQSLLLSVWKRSLMRFKSSRVYKDSRQSAQIAAAFGKKGTLLVGESASLQAFLKKRMADYPFIHLACPLLIPATPAGNLRQPFIVLSSRNRDLSQGFCGIEGIFGASRATEVVSFAWVDRHDRSYDRGISLLLEALGISGVRWVLLPLWETDRRGESDANRFLRSFYSSAKNGDKITEALKKARARLQTKNASRKGNRCSAIRFALF